MKYLKYLGHYGRHNVEDLLGLSLGGGPLFYYEIFLSRFIFLASSRNFGMSSSSNKVKASISAVNLGLPMRLLAMPPIIIPLHLARRNNF